jgi:hypothetical protein
MSLRDDTLKLHKEYLPRIEGDSDFISGTDHAVPRKDARVIAK